MKTIKFVLVVLVNIFIVSCGGSKTDPIPAGIPSAPAGVTATAGNGQVTLSWTAVGGATSYNLYMATQSGVTKSNYAALTGGMIHVSVTNPYVHTGLTNGTKYYFVVTAVNSVGESAESTVVPATPLNISAKFSIAATADREGSWDAAFDGTNYLVGLQQGGTAQTYVGAQIVSQSGALAGSIASTGRVGDPPFVAFDGSNYLLVWRDHTNDPTDSGIWGQFVSTAGALVNSPFKIASGDLTLSARSIIFDGSNYFVVWNTGSSGDLIDLYGQFISPSGSLVGSAIAVSTAAHQQRDFVIGFDGTNILVVFVDGQRYNSLGVNPCGGNLYLPSDISGQFITKSGIGTPGAPSGASFFINQDSFPSDNTPPSVAFDGTNYLVTWNDQMTLPTTCVAGNPEGGLNSVDINGQLVGTNGTLSGAVIPVSSAAGSQLFPTLAFDGINYLVTWTDARNDANSDYVCDAGEGTCLDIYGQFVAKSGGLLGTEFAINADSGNQGQAFLTFAAGKYFVGWTTGSGTGLGSSDDVWGAFITP